MSNLCDRDLTAFRRFLRSPVSTILVSLRLLLNSGMAEDVRRVIL